MSRILFFPSFYFFLAGGVAMLRLVLLTAYPLRFDDLARLILRNCSLFSRRVVRAFRRTVRNYTGGSATVGNSRTTKP